MYGVMLVVHGVAALLICVLVLFSQNKMGGTKDFTTDVYSSDSLMTGRLVNTVLTRAIVVLGAIFMTSSSSLILIEKYKSSSLVRDIGKQSEVVASESMAVEDEPAASGESRGE